MKRYCDTNLREHGAPCEVCGNTFLTVAHHDDYAYPERTRQLCRKHHAEWHAKNGPGANRVRTSDALPFAKSGKEFQISFRGLTRCLEFWSEATGIQSGTLRYRLSRRPLLEVLSGASLRRAHRVYCRGCGARKSAHKLQCPQRQSEAA